MKRLDIFLIGLFLLQSLLWLSAGPSQIEVKEEFFRPNMGLKSVDRLSLELSDEELEFFNDKKLGWAVKLDEGANFPLRHKAMQQFMVQLMSYRSGPIKGESEAKATEFQVTDKNPYARIILGNAKGERKEILMAPGPNDSDYVRIKGEKKIYQMQPSIRWWLSVDTRQWIDEKLSNHKWPSQIFRWKRGSGAERKIGTDGLVWRLGGRELDKKKVVAFLKNMKEMPIAKPLGLSKGPGKESFPITLTISSHKSLGKSMTLKIAPKIIYETGENGYKVMMVGDPRIVFVKASLFMGLLDNDGGPRVFLPEEK
jgi:hypothetical protein